MSSSKSPHTKEDENSFLQNQIRQTFKTALDNSQSHLITKIFPTRESFSAAIAAADFVDSKVKYKDGEVAKAKKKFLHELIANPWVDLQSNLNQWIWEEVLKFHKISIHSKKSALANLETNFSTEIEHTAQEFIRTIRNERELLKKKYQLAESEIQQLNSITAQQHCTHWMDYLLESPMHRSYFSMAKLICEQGGWIQSIENEQLYFENLQKMIQYSKGIWAEIFCIASSVNFEQFNQGIWNCYTFEEENLKSKVFQKMIDRVIHVSSYALDYFSSVDELTIHPFVLLKTCEVEYQCKKQCKLFEKSVEWIIRTIVQYQCITNECYIYLDYFSTSKESALLQLLKLTLEQLLKKHTICTPFVMPILHTLLQRCY